MRSKYHGCQPHDLREETYRVRCARANRRDGKPLDAKEGPFRIIALGDKRQARWVRQVVAIDLLRAPRD